MRITMKKLISMVCLALLVALTASAQEKSEKKGANWQDKVRAERVGFLTTELDLSEAEALCHIGGQDAKVQSLLKELNANLDPSYNCTKTGADLLTEVKLYRRIDLWGEGFDWYDYKRWNEPIVRHNKAQGGSFNDAYAVTINVGDGNKWTWKIPRNETDYNKLISLE